MGEKIILLVEDDPDDEMLTLRALKNAKIVNRVFVVRDGVEALDYLFARNQFSDRDPRDLPQVVLLDLKLPKVDGLQVLEKIRENEMMKFLPVVILTSSKEEQDIVASYNLRANSYVRKPVDFHQFASAVSQLGLYWLLINEAPPVRSVE
ncbi:MAG: response regulator [Acidobacteriota bacterium]